MSDRTSEQAGDAEYAARLRAFTEKMKAHGVLYDQESAHVEADALLCEILKSLGYEETVRAFEEMPKWYA